MKGLSRRGPSPRSRAPARDPIRPSPLPHPSRVILLSHPPSPAHLTPPPLPALRHNHSPSTRRRSSRRSVETAFSRSGRPVMERRGRRARWRTMEGPLRVARHLECWASRISEGRLEGGERRTRRSTGIGLQDLSKCTSAFAVACRRLGSGEQCSWETAAARRGNPLVSVLSSREQLGAPDNRCNHAIGVELQQMALLRVRGAWGRSAERAHRLRRATYCTLMTSEDQTTYHRF